MDELSSVFDKYDGQQTLRGGSIFRKIRHNLTIDSLIDRLSTDFMLRVLVCQHAASNRTDP